MTPFLVAIAASAVGFAAVMSRQSYPYSRADDLAFGLAIGLVLGVLFLSLLAVIAGRVGAA